MNTLNEFLNDRRTDLMIKEYWTVTFYFDDVLDDETSVNKIIKLGYNFSEYYIESYPFNRYYKRFGNLVKNISETLKNKKVKNIEIGCSGREFEAKYNLTCNEMNTLDKFFNIVNA